jgi:O-glycosyl hydrolase
MANASSWQWWLGVSPSDYKDGLVYVADQSGNMGELQTTKSDGIILKSKMLWAMGNYSRFIRPGMRRVEANLEGSSDPLVAASSLMISAYKNAAAKEVVIVAINMTNDNKKIKMNGLTIPGGKYKTYTTTNQKELQFSETSSTEKITLEPRSITTFVGTYQ